MLAFYDDRRRPACAACTGNETVYACTACGREDSPWGRLCGHCALQEKATVLLSSPDGVIHPRLRPVYDALISGPRPQSTLYWFTRSTGPATLGAMARGELDISHATFEAMPASRTNSYLRDLLTALGVLPPFHAELERVSPWLEELLSTLPAGQSEVLARFARWQVLSRLRRQEHHGTLTHGAISAARATIVVTARFMDWLTEDGTDLTDIGQGDLDRYAQQHRARALALRPFLAWRARTGLGGNLSVATRPSTQPAVTLSDEAGGRTSNCSCTTTPSASTPASPACSSCSTPNPWPGSSACAPTRSPSTPTASSPPRSTPSPSSCRTRSTAWFAPT
ncbi:hypothetical protein BJF81_13945 [Ornithinimicrobium sp. CNJ-824]|uniref:hypothetical protein n=1 Tax=Ornithinimicrobium sp. CNJ-824 TaxID=1904966 RepID=UPI000959A5AE|nr:hypothetical protein [Ornithinimicrobium sp. CNJ-824]OLT22059.1 hypothetical protein BJF81_13945 [Ornithinimicrobium sp. CNJ-824]